VEYFRHLELIRSDSTVLVAAVQRDPDAAVPSCPGWTASDVLRHVGEVYEHKVLCMTLGREPDADRRIAPPESGPALAEWFVGQRDALVDELTRRNPSETTFTWFPPDQSVGFWGRRMAVETVVHRVDAELATGTRTSVDTELAADGVDELIRFLVHDFGDSPTVPEGAGRTVELRCGSHRWALTLRADGVDRVADDAAADAGMRAAPEDLLLHLWNRDRGTVVVRTWGDRAALEVLGARFADETT
jgi:uncharacterized protein (TIGR03083 family)